MTSTKKTLKAAALAAVLTAVMLLSSGCITIDIGPGSAIGTAGTGL